MIGIVVVIAALSSISMVSSAAGNWFGGFQGYGMMGNSMQSMMMNSDNMGSMTTMMGGSSNGIPNSTISSKNNMMGGMMNSTVMSQMMGPTATIDNATFNSINTPPSGVLVHKSNNTISISANGTTIPIEAAPVWYPRSGDYWLVYGLVNPTITVKQGARVNFLFMNMDNDIHMPGVTAIPPPYQNCPMMSGMMNSDMSGGGGNSWLGIGPMLSGVANSTVTANTQYSDATLSITFSQTGTYWYLCLVMGHAQMGMYGKLLVS